jgi:hypothetical protein
MLLGGYGLLLPICACYLWEMSFSGRRRQGDTVLTELLAACEQVRSVQLHVAYVRQQTHVTHLHVLIAVQRHHVSPHTPRAYHVL